MGILILEFGDWLTFGTSLKWPLDELQSFYHFFVGFIFQSWVIFFLSLSSLMFILKPPRTSFRSVTRALWLTWRIFNPLLLSLPPATQPAPLHPSLLPDQRYGHHVTCHWSVSRFNREEMRDEPGRKGRGSYILKGLQHLLKAWTLYYPLVCVCDLFLTE